MKLSIKQTLPPTADGLYIIKASGCIAASLFWADEKGKLENWTAFAYIPIKPNGEGVFVFKGGRSIPPEATHVYAKAIYPDFVTFEEALEEIPNRNKVCNSEILMKCVVFSDLHLSAKEWKVCRALKMASKADCVLLTGDLTNDGTPEQISHFYQCLRETLPDKPVFSVTGNHDIPRNPIPQVLDGVCNYYTLQNTLLQKAEQFGWAVEYDNSGAYSASFGNVEIIGLNAVSHWRRFVFKEAHQLTWLDEYLKNSKAKHRILLCHAPLFAHASHIPKQTYLNRNKQLQSILDTHGNVIYLSGHTHYSLNCPSGCAEKDQNGNIYVNAGSIRPTMLLTDEVLQPEEWTEGNGIEINFYNDYVEIIGFSLKSEKKISRSYYLF